jgi:hypothetical protein
MMQMMGGSLDSSLGYLIARGVVDWKRFRTIRFVNLSQKALTTYIRLTQQTNFTTTRFRVEP